MKSIPKALLLVAVLIALAAGARSVPRLFETLNTVEAAPLPSTRVRTGDVTFTVTADGSLQGGNSRMLTAPMAGGGTLTLTDLRKPGELVKKGDVVAQFDTTDETYKLREAESDLAEAEQQVMQAESEAKAKEEDVEYELIAARGELKQAEIEVTANAIRAALTARQNDITLAGAREKLANLERDYPQRKAAASASVAIQEAARKKAEVLADTARRNIEMMTLKAPADGYINVERNTNTNFFFTGMTLPLFQVGDQVPILTRSATGVASFNAPVVNNVDYRNTGVILRVVPRINANGNVLLDIDQEISNVVPGGASLTPTISQRKVKSTISVASGQTVMLGGLISERQQGDRQGIPILERISWLGACSPIIRPGSTGRN